jgi:hypothetical protein
LEVVLAAFEMLIHQRDPKIIWFGYIYAKRVRVVIMVPVNWGTLPLPESMAETSAVARAVGMPNGIPRNGMTKN